MIKCISYWSTRDGLSNTEPIDRAMDAAKAAGFAGIELCIGPEGALNVATSQADCERFRDLAAQRGLALQTLASGMSWGSNPTSDDPAVRRRSIELHAAALQRAAWLGCQAMLFVPGVVASPICPDIIRYDVAVDRAREACKQLLDTAERVGVDLRIENVWNGLMYSPLELCQFVDSFASKRLGVYFDVGNVLGYHQYPPHWIELLGQRIRRVHIKDYKLNFDWSGSYSFCELLQGDVPWQATMQALRKVGYDGTLVAEMLPHSDGLLERTSAAMDKIMKM
ncbi:MAG: sugar phosphate isomerase/epimerase [Phycisphaeraceae bacterium]|nr:sugar phosphate isomerase/epimerase [Phycisphaeraceae bacterium]